MSTIKDFENAPVGATATNEYGLRAIKLNYRGQWASQSGAMWDSGDMERYGYRLDPAPAPTTAREALALAWELAHPVKAGQIIPEDAEFIHLSPSGKYSHFKTRQGGDAVSAQHAHEFRTLDPLPEPEPAWLDAPAILASHPLCADTEQIGIWIPSNKDDMWEWPVQQGEFSAHWSELEEVTPLYPKGQD